MTRNCFFVQNMPCLAFGFWTSMWVLRFGDTNDEHNLIMGANQITIELLGFRIDRAPTLIKSLRRLTMISFALTIKCLIKRRPTLLQSASVNHEVDRRMHH